VILADAGPLVALLIAADQHHRRCAAALREIHEPLATVWPAITEAMYLLEQWPRAQDELWARLESGALQLLQVGEADYARMRELMHKYADRPMDLADAALVRVAERERIFTVFTVDRSDFEVYRPLGRRFRIVP
jgi:predicted nucleic acid-binding protein